MTSKYCISCGTPLTGAKFCTVCGRPATPGPADGWPSGATGAEHSGPMPAQPGPVSDGTPGGWPPPRKRGHAAAIATSLLALVVVGTALGLLLWRLAGNADADAAAPASSETGTAAGTASSSPVTPEPSSSAEPAATAVQGPDNLDCTEQFLVVFEVTGDEADLDKDKPWLQAEASCAGIDREIGGKPLRFNYLGPYDSAQQACEQLLAMDLHADFVKLLRADQGGGRHYLCSCDGAAADLPSLADTDGHYPQDPVAFRAVTDLHLMLKRIQGFKSDNLGMYGQQTTDAVREFQAASALPETGQVDEVTWSALLAAPGACPD